jgi:hypothetical protein
VTLPPQLYQKVKNYDLNLSAFLQIKLVEYFVSIEGNVPRTQTIQPYTPETHHQGTPPTEKTPGKTSELYGEVGLLRFERKSMAPEATRIPSYPTGPMAPE